MGDLIGFQGYLNTTTPFTLDEHKVQWKSDRRYRDFSISNNYQQDCQYPRFWQETGYRVYPAVKGCYDELSFPYAPSISPPPPPPFQIPGFVH